MNCSLPFLVVEIRKISDKSVLVNVFGTLLVFQLFLFYWPLEEISQVVESGVVWLIKEKNKAHTKRKNTNTNYERNKPDFGHYR